MSARLQIGLLLSLGATVVLLCLENCLCNQSLGESYALGWSSETMMQTVSIEDLRDQPFRTLWYLHIQPPAYDALRAVLAHVLKSDNSPTLLGRVDRALLILWALLYGAAGFIVFWWVSEVGGVMFAAISTMFFFAHPACVLYATLLDTTLLTAVLLLCFCYLLWRVKEGRSVPVGWLVLAFLALFFTRAMFNGLWLAFLVAALCLLRFPVRKIVLFAVLTGAIVGLYMVKQQTLFRLSGGSSFAGMNLCNSIGISEGRERYMQLPPTPQGHIQEKARVLHRVRKISGALNFNNAYYLTLNRELLQEFRQALRGSSWKRLAEAYVTNLQIFMGPSSQYAPHGYLDRLPQRAVYDAAFSHPILPVLLGIAALVWFAQARAANLAGAIGLSMPVLFVVVVSVVCERGENMRFKFFVEPVLFVFLFTQVYAAGVRVASFWRKAPFAPAAKPDRNRNRQ